MKNPIKNIFSIFLLQALMLSSAIMGAEKENTKNSIIKQYPGIVMSHQNDTHRIDIRRNFNFDGVAHITDLKSGKEWSMHVLLPLQRVSTFWKKRGIFSPDQSKFVFAQYGPTTDGWLDEREKELFI